METTIRPLASDVVIRCPFTPEEETNGELDTPPQFRGRTFTAQVLAVGPGDERTQSGDPIRPGIEEGSFVIFKSSRYQPILRDGGGFVTVLGCSDIICGTSDRESNDASNPDN